MLLGAEIHLHTDHHNLTHFNFSTQCVLRWHLFIEEFHPLFHYVPGPDNVLADFLSHSNLSKGDDMLPSTDVTIQIATPADATSLDPIDSFMLMQPQLFLDCFLNEPNPRTPMNPVNYLQLQTAQWQQPGLLQLLQHDPIRYSLQWFGHPKLT